MEPVKSGALYFIVSPDPGKRPVSYITDNDGYRGYFIKFGDGRVKGEGYNDSNPCFARAVNLTGTTSRGKGEFWSGTELEKRFLQKYHKQQNSNAVVSGSDIPKRSEWYFVSEADPWKNPQSRNQSKDTTNERLEELAMYLDEMLEFFTILNVNTLVKGPSVTAWRASTSATTSYTYEKGFDTFMEHCGEKFTIRRGVATRTVTAETGRNSGPGPTVATTTPKQAKDGNGYLEMPPVALATNDPQPKRLRKGPVQTLPIRPSKPGGYIPENNLSFRI